MTYRDTEIVSAVRTCLQANLGEDRFELWFGSRHRFVWNDDTLRIDVDSPFRADRLRARLHAEIAAAIRDVLPGDYKLLVEVDVALLEPAEDEGEGSREESDVLGDRVASEDEAIISIHEGYGVARSQSGAADAGKARLRTRGGANASADSSAALALSSVAKPKSKNPWNQRESGSRKFASLKTLVRGTSNQIACHASQLVIDQPGQVNPLFIHGPTGSGKTHLLEGIWSEVRRRGGRRIIYLSSEQFTTYFLQALRGSGLPSFRQKYRAVDLFILDDVQFFAGKQATVTELLHTIDSLLRESRQLVLAADRPATELEHLGSELQTRIAGGLVCAVQPLDAEMRRGVLQRLAAERQLKLTPELLDQIAERAPGDARQLSGIINRLWAAQISLGHTPSASMADDVLSELCPATGNVVNLQDIQRVICDEFGLAPEQLCSDRRTREVSHPRMLAMWLARKHTRAALTEIGEFFGRRSHSTVVSAQNKVERWVTDGQHLSLTRHHCDVKSVLSRLERSLRA